MKNPALLCCLVAILFLVVVHGSEASEYLVYDGVADDKSVVCSSGGTGLLRATCSVNTCRTTTYIEYYKIPKDHLKVSGVGFESYHGSLITPSNHSLTYEQRFNDTHYAVGVVAEYYAGGGTTDYYYSRPFWYNGSVNFLGTTHGGTKVSVSLVTSYYDYLFDGLTSTGAFSIGESGTCTWRVANEATDEARIRHLGVYWDYGGPALSVKFIIKNELNNFVQGANVTVTRESDGTLIGSSISDLSGQVLFELREGIAYRVNVTREGFTNYSGVITAIDLSYQIVLGGIGSAEPFNSVFSDINMVFSPGSSPVSPNITNFTMTISSLSDSLSWWGVISVFNNITYTNNNTNSSGGQAYITLPLVNMSGTVNVLYYFHTNNKTYSILVPYRISNIQTGGSSLLDIDETFGSEFTPLGKVVLATIALIILIILLTASGIPSDVGSIASMVIVNTTGIFIGWISPVIGGMVILICIGLGIMISRRDIT